MKPVTNQYSAKYILSNDLIWTGPNIPCLDICTGNLINAVIYNIASKLCDALAPYDVSTLTLEGVYDILGTDESGDRTLLSVLQLYADAQVELKELIDNLQKQVDGMSDDSLTLDLKCFKSYDSFGNQIPYTQQSVLQILINDACSNDELMAALSGKITELEARIDEIEDSIPSGDEVVISTCISSNKPVSKAVIDLADNYCDYKIDVGDSFKIQQNISKLTAALNSKYVGYAGWTQNPSNMADFVGNLAIIEQAHEDRISVIESTCCQVTCKDLTLGFEISPASNQTVYLRFTHLAGTDIPSSFTDKGSTLQITDYKNNSVSYNITIESDKLLGEFSYAGLDTSEPLNFNVSASMGNESLTCEKCINKTYSPESGCPVCAVTATGKTGSVTIVYTYSSI